MEGVGWGSQSVGVLMAIVLNERLCSIHPTCLLALIVGVFSVLQVPNGRTELEGT